MVAQSQIVETVSIVNPKSIVTTLVTQMITTSSNAHQNCLTEIHASNRKNVQVGDAPPTMTETTFATSASLGIKMMTLTGKG